MPEMITPRKPDKQKGQGNAGMFQTSEPEKKSEGKLESINDSLNQVEQNLTGMILNA